MSTAIGGLTASDHRVWRLVHVAGLLDPDNAELLRHLPGVRRVLAVAPAAALRKRLEEYLDVQCRRGLLDGYHVAAVHEATTSPLTAVGRLGTTAVAAGLARRDAFLMCGHGPGVNEALVAAAMLRRHTPAVWVVTDLEALAAARGHRGIVSIPGGIAVQHRQVTVLVDEDRLTKRVNPSRKIVEHIAHPTFTYHVEAVSDVFTPERRRHPPRRSEDRLTAWLPEGSRVLALVDAFSAEIADDVRSYLQRALARGDIARYTVREITSSPAVKTLSQAEVVVGVARRMGLGAGDRMLAVGGGTVMDLVGAAALVYEGATPYLRIPTTLVGMIDAGVGLKVGVDVNARKNLLGGYHPPLACLCDSGFLATLPEAEIRCGLAEAIKIAMVTDRGLFELIEQNWPDVIGRRQSSPVRTIITRSIKAMLAQLAANPFERDLCRLPDFGHEFGHLLEAASGYRLRHGEAVSIGMAISVELGVLTGRLSRTDRNRLTHLLSAVGLPTFDPLCEPERLWRWLRTDICAHKGGAPHLVVPTGLGAGGFIHSLDQLSEDALRRACLALSGTTR